MESHDQFRIRHSRLQHTPSGAWFQFWMIATDTKGMQSQSPLYGNMVTLKVCPCHQVALGAVMSSDTFSFLAMGLCCLGFLALAVFCWSPHSRQPPKASADFLRLSSQKSAGGMNSSPAQVCNGN